jgi:hypothetical protein
MRRSISALIWPRYIASSPGIVARAGRVLHWAFVAASLALFVPLMQIGDVAFSVALAITIGLLLAGRAIRYILSAE